MRSKYVMSMAIVLVFSICGARPDGSRSPLFIDPRFQVKVTNDLVYATAPVQSPETTQKPLLLDLYEPDGESAPPLRPGFIAIHGGGLSSGDRRNEDMVELCQQLAARGYACASIDYRLMGDDPPAQGGSPYYRTMSAAIEDAGRAVAWLRNNAARYNVDPGRIAVGGSSAGAEIALRLGYDDPPRRAPVAAVLSWMGGLSGNESIIEADEPPLFIIHGADDDMVRVAEARAIARRAAQIGLTYKIFICEGLGHLVPLDRRPAGVSLYRHLTEFLHHSMGLANLGPPGSPQRSAQPKRSANAQADMRAVQCPR